MTLKTRLGKLETGNRAANAHSIVRFTPAEFQMTQDRRLVLERCKGAAVVAIMPTSCTLAEWHRQYAGILQ